MSATPPRNIFFPLVVACGGLFLVTVLAMVAATLGDPQAPASRFFQASGMWLIIGETAALVLVALLAMGLDQYQTRRQSTSSVKPLTGASHPEKDAAAAARDTPADES